MMTTKKNILRSYSFLFLLLFSTLMGSFVGYRMGGKAIVLKPLGDIFLNLMFTVVIPLIFFSMASAISSIGELKRIMKIMSNTLIIFMFTSVIAAIYMLVIVQLFPPAHGVSLNMHMMAPPSTSISIGEQIANIFTVNDFYKLFSRENILALIIFAGLVGFATASLKEKGKPIDAILRSGTEVSMKMVGYVMYYAPIGFFAYFAVLVGQLGQEILSNYVRAFVIYYSAALVYFVIVLSFYAYISDRKQGIKNFWKYTPLPLMTALATCSSAASIPANLQATQRIGVPAEIYETVVPLGAILHKDGSVLGGMLKIAFLFGIFQMNFTGWLVILTAILIAVLVGTVMGAIPSGGMIAEMLILSLYGFPPQALIIIAAISILIDPPATLLNVLGNTTCSMLVTRRVQGKDWLKRSSPSLQ